MMEHTPTPEPGPAQAAPGCVCMGSGPVFSDFLKRFGPDESVRHHFRNARIEFLKGLREMLDHRIAELSRQAQPRGAKITVE